MTLQDLHAYASQAVGRYDLEYGLYTTDGLINPKPTPIWFFEVNDT